jgi:hypothetical protein
LPNSFAHSSFKRKNLVIQFEFLKRLIKQFAAVTIAVYMIYCIVGPILDTENSYIKLPDWVIDPAFRNPPPYTLNIILSGHNLFTLKV